MKRTPPNPTTGVTEGKLRTLLKSNLRPIWRATSRRVFIASMRYHATNAKTGRNWYVVECKDCGRTMGCSEKEKRPLVGGGMSKKARGLFEVHHIDSIVPLADIRDTLGEHFHSMIYGKMEILCIACHKLQTAAQTKQRNINKKK